MSEALARRSGVLRGYPVKAATNIESNEAVFLTTGLATGFAGAVATSKFVGVSTLACDNSAGAASALSVEVEHQEFALVNASDIKAADIGVKAYFATTLTVSKDSDTNKRPEAGTITEIDGNLVWIKPAIV